jgi:hypothetical protein
VRQRFRFLNLGGAKAKNLDAEGNHRDTHLPQMRQPQVTRIRRPKESHSTAYWEHRKRLQDLIERMELEYDKALLALHPLGITVGHQFVH